MYEYPPGRLYNVEDLSFLGSKKSILYACCFRLTPQILTLLVRDFFLEMLSSAVFTKL